VGGDGEAAEDESESEEFIVSMSLSAKPRAKPKVVLRQCVGTLSSSGTLEEQIVNGGHSSPVIPGACSTIGLMLDIDIDGVIRGC
jgi:hypothetical protein